MIDRPKWDALAHIEASKYLSSRGVTPEDIANYKIEFVDVATAADRLGLGSRKRERRAECAIWLSGWRADGTVNDQYGNAVFFYRNPWDGKVERSRLGPWKERLPLEIG